MNNSKKQVQDGKRFHFYGTKQCLNYRGETCARRTAFTGIVNNGILSIGAAYCSEQDQFVKRIGRGKSISRAIRDPFYRAPIDIESKVSDQFVSIAVDHCETVEFVKHVSIAFTMEIHTM